MEREIFSYPLFWIFSVTSVNESMTLMTITFRIVVPMSPFVFVSIYSVARTFNCSMTTVELYRRRWDGTHAPHSDFLLHEYLSRFVSRRWAFLSTRDYRPQSEKYCHSFVKSIQFEVSLPYLIPLINMLFRYADNALNAILLRRQNNFETFKR